MENKPRRGKKRLLKTLILLVILGGYCTWVLRQPIAALQPAINHATISSQTVNGKLPWPVYGQAAVGIVGASAITQNGTQTAVPIASVAKVLTSLAVLQKKPLNPGEQGPSITLGGTDTDLYNSYVAKEGSVTPVNSGEVITEYQMLEAVLLPSANNVADSMAIWAFGSLDAYTTYANSYVKKLGLVNTKVADDASGFSPATVSTTRDLVRLGQAAMANPVIAEIVSKAEASDVPVAGKIYNVNSLLGTSGIVGIKTGNTVRAGGVFLGASKTVISKKPVTVLTAIAGAPDLATALNDTKPLTEAAQKNFAEMKLLTAGSVVGSYHQPWGGIIPVIASKDVSAFSWKGLVVPVTISLDPVSDQAHAGQVVGHITAHKSMLDTASSVDAVLQTTPTRPPVWWRLLHPLDN